MIIILYELGLEKRKEEFGEAGFEDEVDIEKDEDSENSEDDFEEDSDNF